MWEWGRRIGVTIALAIAATLVPSGFDEAAACSPRLFRELGPAPSRVAAPPAETPPADQTADQSGELAPAPPQTPPQPVTPPPPRCSFYYDMDHPVPGRSSTLSVFGAIRDAGERWHAGVDIAAAKLAPVVAVRAGTVREANRNGQGDCCWVKIQHNDGWQSLYVHLNNDLAGTDSGDGVGIVRQLEVGDTVRRGQVIGYVGDSGNAEPGVPHLHFELRTPWGESVDPLPSIRRAASRGITAFRGIEEPPVDFSGPFADLGDASADMVALGVSLAIPLACDEYGLFFCGDAEADETTLAEWAAALTADRLDPSTWESGDDIPDDEAPEGPQEAENDIRSFYLGGTPVERLESPLTSEWDEAEFERFVGLCTEACPGSITRQDVLDLVPPTTGAPPVRVAYLEADALSCQPTPADATISRAQLLEMLMRAFGFLPTLVEPPCDRIS